MTSLWACSPVSHAVLSSQQSNPILPFESLNPLRISLPEAFPHSAFLFNNNLESTSGGCPPQRTCTRLIRQHPQITLLQADFLLNVSFTGVIGILTAPSSSCVIGLIPKVAMFTGKVFKRLLYLEDSDIKHLLFQLRSHLSGLSGGGGNSYQEVEPSYK